MAYIPSECSLEEYEKVIYSGDAKNRLYVKHGDTIIGTNGDNNASPFASKLTIKRRILKNGSKTITLNNFISQEIDLVLHDYKIENLSEEIEIKIGTFIDSVNDYVYVPIGKFLIQDNPTTDKNKTTYKLRDFSIKFDFYYNAKPLIDANGGKATKLQILKDICEQAGVVCKIKSFVGHNDEIGIYDNSITARTYITYIAEQAGKMASINRYGELIFVDITSDESSIIGTNEITLENAVEKRIDSFVIEGNSKQDTRSGRNLYNYKDTVWVDEGYTIDEEGWITINVDNTSGTSTKYINYYTNNLKIEPSTDYNIIVEVKEKTGGGGLAVTSIYSGNSEEGQFPYWDLKIPEVSNGGVYQKVLTSRDISDSVIYGLRTFLAMGAGYSGSITFRISVLEDTTITPETFEYEPYGISPSLEFPSEIKTIKGYENKFNKNDYVQGWLRYSDNALVDPTQTTFYSTGFIEVKGNTNHIIDFYNQTSLNSGGIMQYDENKNWLGDGIAETEQVMRFKTKPSTKYVRFVFRMDAIDNIRFMEGTELKPYVEYGSNYLAVQNKTANIFIPSEMTYWSNLAPSWEMYGNGIKINTSSTQGGSGVYCSFAQMSNKVDGKTVTFSFSIKSSVDTKLMVGAEYLGKIVDVTTEYKRFSQTLNDFWNYDWYPFVFYNQYANGAEIYVQDMQLEIDDKESPYNECETKTITYNLQGNELVAIGNIKDELDIVTGTLTKRIGKVVLNGSENWEMIGTNVAGKNRFQTNDYANKVVSNFDGNQYLNALSNKFIPTTPNETYLCKTGIASVNQYFVFFNESVYDSLENWINWLSNNPVTVYYELAQPEIIQLDATEIKTFEGTNYITTHTGLETNVSLDYASKKYVHNISPNIVEKFTAGDIYKVSKLLFEAGVNKFEDGTDDNDTLYLNSDNPYINQQNQINNIFPNVKGFEINSFKTGKILGNPTVDPSDLIKIEYDGIIYKTLAQYTLNFGGTMTSNYETTVEHEAKQSNVTNSGFASMKKYVQAQLDNIDAKFTVEVGEVNSNLTNLQTNINNTADRVSNTESKINDTNTNLENLVGRTTQLEQDAKSWTFEFTNIYEDLSALEQKANETDATTKEIKDYIKFVDGNIILEGTDSKCSVVISKEKISFYTDGNESAYLSNNELYITDNTVLNKQTIGKWELKPDSEGNLNTRWIG